MGCKKAWESGKWVPEWRGKKARTRATKDHRIRTEQAQNGAQEQVSCRVSWDEWGKVVWKRRHPESHIAEEAQSLEVRERSGSSKGQRISAGLHGRVWLGQGVRVQNSCRGLREPPAVASVNFKEGLSPWETWRWGLEPWWHGTRRGHWAVYHAPKPSDAELTEKRLRREAPSWCLLSAPSPLCLY